MNVDQRPLLNRLNEAVAKAITEVLLPIDQNVVGTGETKAAFDSYRFDCFIDHATGGKLSKNNVPLDVLKQYVDYHVNDMIESALKEYRADLSTLLKAFVAIKPLAYGTVGTRDEDVSSWIGAHQEAERLLVEIDAPLDIANVDPRPVLPGAPCKGENCGTTTNDHSVECNAEHDMASSTEVAKEVDWRMTDRIYIIMNAEQEPSSDLQNGREPISWWTPDDVGFVYNVNYAGHKTYDEAMALCNSTAGNALPWLASEVIKPGKSVQIRLSSLPRGVATQREALLRLSMRYVNEKATGAMRAALPFVHPGVTSTLQKLVAERDAGWTSDAVNALTKLQTLINMHGCGKP